MKFAWVVMFLSAGLWAQQNIPDAPVPSTTATPLVDTGRPLQPTTQITPAPKATPDGTGESSSSDNLPPDATRTLGESGSIAPIVHPTPTPVGAVTGNGEPQTNTADQLTTFTKVINFVYIPVTVKDSNGRLVQGLQPNDFTVYEDGQPQTLKYFTSDPFPLSVAFLIDENIKGNTMKRVNASLGAVVGALAPTDEIAVFTYGTNWKQESEFTNAGNKLSITLKSLQERPIESSQAPILGGPLSGVNDSPTVNGMHIDPRVSAVQTPEKEYHLLNDALLNAALQLAKRPEGRRRIIFVVSNGYEKGSQTSSKIVLQTLLSHHITVYGMNVGEGAIPVVNTMERIHLPKVPNLVNYNLVPHYASRTGGTVYSEFSEEAIQDAYMKVTQEARDQYTLGYYSHVAPVSGHKTMLEVRVHRPNLKVYAREGFYPLPTKPAPVNR